MGPTAGSDILEERKFLPVEGIERRAVQLRFYLKSEVTD
jgi:hypothetical protein